MARGPWASRSRDAASFQLYISFPAYGYVSSSGMAAYPCGGLGGAREGRRIPLQACGYGVKQRKWGLWSAFVWVAGWLAIFCWCRQVAQDARPHAIGAGRASAVRVRRMHTPWDPNGGDPGRQSRRQHRRPVGIPGGLRRKHTVGNVACVCASTRGRGCGACGGAFIGGPADRIRPWRCWVLATWWECVCGGGSPSVRSAVREFLPRRMAAGAGPGFGARRLLGSGVCDGAAVGGEAACAIRIFRCVEGAPHAYPIQDPYGIPAGNLDANTGTASEFPGGGTDLHRLRVGLARAMRTRWRGGADGWALPCVGGPSRLPPPLGCCG